MKDFEKVVFKNNQEMKGFIDKQEADDQWVKLYSSEMETIPLENNELNLHIPDAFAYELRNGVVVSGFESETSEEDIISSMQTTKMSVVLPINNKFVMYPVRYTAWEQIQARSGIGGVSISSVKDKANAYEMAPADRCSCINMGLALRRDKTLALIRDGKVSALLSGDENGYTILHTSDLVTKVEALMSNSFSSFEWETGEMTHEIFACTYTIKDDELEQKIRNLLSSYGIANNKKVKVQVLLTTSDVGRCAARLTPLIYLDGIRQPIGIPACVDHKGGEKTKAGFDEMARTFMAKYRENVANLQKLMSVKIKHPAECLFNVYTALKLSGYMPVLKVCMDRIAQEHISGCTAYDVYYMLAEMLYITEENNAKAGKGSSLYENIKAQECIAKVLFMDIAQYDC